MPINYGQQRDDDDRFVSEHAAPGIQRTYRRDPDRSEQSLDACEWCHRTREQCQQQRCFLGLADEQPGRHCPTCRC